MNAPLAAESGIQTYTAPRTIEDAARALAGGGATIIAGGTDLMTDPAAPWSERPGLVNISRVDSMRGIAARDGKIEIGALGTVTDVLNSDLLRDTAPVLPETADRFASDQIRNMATLGGNIANASPAGDMIIPLLLLDAEIDLVSWDGTALATRTVPLDGIFEGPGRSSIRQDELLTAIRFAEPEAGFSARFEKSGPRPALEVALVSAGVAGIKRGDTLSSVRVKTRQLLPHQLGEMFLCPGPCPSIARGQGDEHVGQFDPHRVGSDLGSPRAYPHVFNFIREFLQDHLLQLRPVSYRLL